MMDTTVLTTTFSATDFFSVPFTFMLPLITTEFKGLQETGTRGRAVTVLHLQMLQLGIIRTSSMRTGLTGVGGL